MRVAVCQSNYIPWKGYFDMINMADIFVIYDDVQYTKNDWRSRNRIKTKEGLSWLSIPVHSKNRFHQNINQTLVFEKNWAARHWKTIQGNYSKSKWFKDYKFFFADLYASVNSESLSQINQEFLFKICRLLDIRTEFIQSSTLELQGDKTERLVEICLKLKADSYLTGPAARAYLSEDVFRNNNIQVEWMNYDNYPEYNQLFPPFEHAVSIIDLIFNEGPAAPNFMKSFNNE